MLLQIHDELVFEIAEGESERVRELVRTMME
jgi:DNA polymerase I-like protein with 3'-5' exonuclease and polymerase domains